MKIDIISIFPEYFSPLSLSLIGKAIQDGLLAVSVYDLRDWTHDRHRTVDDTPYGGGAGMVMKPEPWGEALDTLKSQALGERPLLIFPTPSGAPFTQSMAVEFAQSAELIFGCGRYEGIDRRVFDWAAGQFDVREVSLGDYVLNGGEVAVLAMIEAVVRLLPGVLGNQESLVEESFSKANDGLLEYPVYTKPASWRGLDVPEILLSGDHGKVDAYRKEESIRVTRERRPELLNDVEQNSGPDEGV